MRAGDQVGDGLHRRDAHPLLQRDVHQFGLLTAGQEAGDLGTDGVEVGLGDLAGDHAGVQGGPVPVPEPFAERALAPHPGEQLVGRRPDRRADRQVHFGEATLDWPFRAPGQGAAAGHVHALGAGVGVRFRRPGDEVGMAHRFGQHRRKRRLRHALLHADVDMLAAPALRPREMGDQGCVGAVGRGVVIGLRHADAQRLVIKAAGVEQRPAGGPQGDLAVGPAGLRPIQAERGDRDMDQRRIDLGQRVGRQPGRPPIRRRGRLDQEVGARDQPMQEGQALRRAGIADHRPLARRVGRPIERVLPLRPVRRERRVAARGRTLRRFELDHIGAQLGEHMPRQRAAMVGQVEDAVGTEKTGGGRHAASKVTGRVFSPPTNTDWVCLGSPASSSLSSFGSSSSNRMRISSLARCWPRHRCAP